MGGEGGGGAEGAVQSLVVVGRYARRPPALPPDRRLGRLLRLSQPRLCLFLPPYRWPVFSNVWLIGINFVFFLVGLLMIGARRGARFSSCVTERAPFSRRAPQQCAAPLRLLSLFRAGLSSWGIAYQQSSSVTAGEPRGISTREETAATAPEG